MTESHDKYPVFFQKNDKEIVIMALENLLIGSPIRSQALTALRCLTRIKISDVSDEALDR